MAMFDIAALFGDAGFGGGFGGGFAVGMGAGMGAGIGVGMVLFSGGGVENLKRQLSQAIDDGEITVRSKSGNELTADDLLGFLGERYKKA